MSLDVNSLRERATMAFRELIHRLRRPAWSPRPLPPPLTEDQKLLLAARRSRLDEVVVALDRGADVNAADAKGWTALMHASQLHWVEGVEFLVSHGAAVNLFDHLGWGALGIAEYQGDRTAGERARRLKPHARSFGPMAG